MVGFEIIGSRGPRTRSKRYVYDMEGRSIMSSIIRDHEEVWVVQPGRYVIVDVDWKRKKRMYKVAFWCVEISDCWEYTDGTRCKVGYAKLLERKQGTPDIHEDDIQKAVLMCREKEEVR
jgi:hypothetical protein